MLDLSNFNEKDLLTLVDKYSIGMANNHLFVDDDLNMLFYDSKIEYGNVMYKAKNWEDADEEGCITNCQEGDYLETVELIQNGEVYLCQAFAEKNWNGLCYSLALLTVTKKNDGQITDKIRKKVLDYLQLEPFIFSDEFYSFYYRCIKSGIDYASADRYAILNTLFNYDIGIKNAIAIESWMDNHDKEVYELTNSEESKALIKLAADELGLNLDFSKWIKENYTEYKFFEKL